MDRYSKTTNNSNEAGIYLILTTLIVSALAGLIVLAVDIGMIYRDKLLLQKMSDASVAAGLAYEASHRSLPLAQRNADRQQLIAAIIRLNNRDILNLQLPRQNNQPQTNPHIVYNDSVQGDPQHQNLPLTYPDGTQIFEEDANGVQQPVTIPPQGLGVAIQYRPRFYFSILRDDQTIRGRAFSYGHLRPANIALLLDFSASMCCQGVSNCNIASCSHRDPNFANTKAFALIRSVQAFLQNFRNHHDNISFTLFNTVAETRFPMSDTTFGDVIRNQHNPHDNFQISWFPRPIDNNVQSLQNAILNPQNSWDEILSNTIFSGNTNPSDALIRAYMDTLQNYRADGIDPLANNPNEPVRYVFFTDGAPTAGRFFIRAVNSNSNGTYRTELGRNPNLYNPYEIPVNNARTYVGDYYSYKYMYVWQVDAAGNPTQFQYVPSPLIYTARDNATIDTRDDGNIVAKLSHRTLQNSINFSDADPNSATFSSAAQFGSAHEGRLVNGREIPVTNQNGQQDCKYENGIWSEYIWNDQKFHFLPPCSYGGRNRENLTSGNYQSPADAPNPVIPASPVQPIVDCKGVQHEHQTSNYRNWFETANLGLCCARSGNRLQNRGESLFANVDGALSFDLCNYTSPNDRICPNIDPTALPPSVDADDPVWDKQTRCLLPVTAPFGSSASTVFNVPFSTRTFRENVNAKNHPENADNWAKLYYDAAIEYADMIRTSARPGVIYAIGLGQSPNYNANPNLRSDFYQDVHNDFIRHDFFLTRLAADPYIFQLDYNAINNDGFPDNDGFFTFGCKLGEANCRIVNQAINPNSKSKRYNTTYTSAPQLIFQRDPDSTSTRHWNDVPYNLRRNSYVGFFNYGEDYVQRDIFGEYYPTDNPDKLSEMFKQVAKNILLSLAR